MDTQIKDGSFDKNENGLPVSVCGPDELLQRAYISLCVPRGSFLHDKAFGSRLPEILNCDGKSMDSMALLYAQDALRSQPLRALGAKVNMDTHNAVNSVTVKLLIENEIQEVVIDI
jgi:hypothetical protein